ncbi:MAG TPA: hydantoinase B/oxoprolinase family protein, partial [Thermodesulfovibrionales bacterium]|nr:hydantoinase B/oxoprolinase family protein [Thermodesulfovibrionales bacterium]
MALAIKAISISKGFDVREYALVCFGGAGGQHACSIARLLDMETIIVHPLGSLMSAFGIGISEPAHKTVQTVLMPYNRETHELLGYKFAAMEKHLRFVTEDASGADWGKAYITEKEIDLRPGGTDAFLTLRYETFEKTLEEFNKQYRRLFGFGTEGMDMEVVNLRLELQRQTTGFFGRYTGRAERAGAVLEPALHQRIFYVSGTLDAHVYMREDLPSGAVVKGPAIIVDPNTSVVVDPDFSVAIDSTGIMTITNLRMLNEHISSGIGKPDPVLLEVFNNLFMGIAADMGITLGNTARSVNMKERLDFSCAVFDAGGGLVANAPHIPVHLGAMADTVKAVLLDNTGLMKPGDVYLTNNPYRGGSHLPDLTVVCPVFSEHAELIFFTASRGHHSDIGGNTPGSMPPVASHIDEEGVLIDNFLLVSGGAFREAELREILTSHKYPARNPDTNISDIRAQIASCQKGAQALLSAAGRYGIGTVIAYMRHIQKNAEFSVRRTLCEFLGGRPTLHSTFEDHMDDGSIVRVAVTIDAGANPPETARATIDFAGTGVQHSKDNLNTPSSVTRSAVMYVLRTLTSAAIPLNSGCLSPVDILIPDGSLLMPVFPAPVASGNVETSQRVVDVLLGAFNVAAASQGTMNNLLFQVEGETPYYETIAGGAGATRSCRGASGVQVHMTNTLITDPEVLECRHPGVLLERFSLRKNSGGKGVLSGGDGVVREIKFLKPATVSILSERRVFAPYGIEGGEDGQKGLNLLKKSDGNLQELGPREVFRVDKDDSVIIKTPGGGGYGKTD